MVVAASPRKTVPDAGATATVAYATSTAASDGTAPFEDRGDLEAGRVLVLQFEAIAEHLAQTWQSRRVEVYDCARRTLAKRLKGVVVRLSETEFMASAPGLDAEVVEERAVRAMREIVEAYLGEAAATDLRLSRAVAVHPGHVVCAPLDAALIIARGERRAVRPSQTWANDAGGGAPWAAFVAADGRLVRPSCKLEPVFELAGSTRIGYRLRRELIDMATGAPVSRAVQRQLSRADTLRIDRAILARGIDRLRAAATHEAQLSLIIPVSYFTLTHPDAAALLSAMFAQARDTVRAGVICEIYDIEDISQASLAAAVALVRPWCLLVAGCLGGGTPRASSVMKAAGLQVFAFSTPDTLESDAEFIGWLRSAMSSARRIGRSAMVSGCQNRRQLGIAALLGASHASLTS